MITRFTQNETILKLVDEIPKNKQYSDIEDIEGNQYVDLVQEGGGVLGIALVGYTYILEKAKIRFLSLAGTSAGAINTMMMAGLGRIQEKKSEKILTILSQQNLFDLVDGPRSIKRLIDKAIKKEKGIMWSLVWSILPIYKRLKKYLGLNPGNYFESWIQKELKLNNVYTLQDLKSLRSQLPLGLKNIVTGEEVNDVTAKLAIITSDITTHTKTEFPKMAELYWSNPESISPAKLVRASMSIPFFFEPFQVDAIPNAGDTDDKKWKEYASYMGPIPSSVKFVDGGMLSNFPINVFHREDGGVPRMPTFGVRLSAYRDDYSKAKNVFGMSLAMVSTMRQIHDYDFLLKNPDYKHLICRIDADEMFNWLDFNMSEEDQIKLFNLGAKKAVEFLKNFDWEAYKKIRGNKD
ncbi:patatin-like phospholipase family protein [Pseudotenacibaculum sp. MALMAid0570]|uniref:patatin-like phospholipase family protein n=1 Tax=Pseudotenacibaculum sp. MALMAid0570 TaxID=3143938 RepID=UPI0032E03674